HIVIALIHLAVGQGDLLAQNGAEAKTDAALDLGADQVRVDRQAAVDGRNDTIDLHTTTAIGRDLRNLRTDRSEAFRHRDTAETPLWQRLRPFGFFRSEFQDNRMA